MIQDHEQVLSGLNELHRSHELSILKISEPISAEGGANTPGYEARRSDASSDGYDSPRPASLEADLSHYKVERAMSSGRTGRG